MVDHAWFRLLMRAIGLLLLGFGVPSLFMHGARAIEEHSWPVWPPANGDQAVRLLREVMYLAGPMSQTAFGLYLFFFGSAIVRKCLKDAAGRCPCCQYDVRGNPCGVCPECGMGARAPHSKIAPHPRA